MIGRLHGAVLEKNAPWILLDVQGVGYELQVPMSTLFNLPDVGQACILLTHLVVREDAHALYGFSSNDEKSLFKTLIKVSGIGPRTALAILSSISTQDFYAAVHGQDTTRLVKIPGIGKKTAERLLLELKGQIGSGLSSATPSSMPGSTALGQQSEVVQALCALGYSDKEAQAACKGMAEDISVTDGLKFALKQLARN